jgi:EAL domain-containing protein (putative c-di-GMP-specific phosphodiesterase class I)
MKEVFTYINNFNISFAIDDFGIGHSSISRLLTMDLNHIKVDRDILLHPHPEVTISYVQNIIKKYHPHRNEIVIEGYDGCSQISLRQLYDLGIRHVQGHMIRVAMQSVSDLNEQEIEFIEGELSKKQKANLGSMSRSV